MLTNKPDSESNMRENGQNNHILKPSLIPSTYKIVSAPQPRIWSHTCIPPNSSSGKSHSWLHAYQKHQQNLKKKKENGQTSCTTAVSGRGSVFWNFYKCSWSTASVGDHLFCLRFSKFVPLFWTSMPLHELLIQSRIHFLLASVSCQRPR